MTVRDELIELTAARISDFERQPDQLTPRQVELAIIHTITSIMRTTNQLARLLEEADNPPTATPATTPSPISAPASPAPTHACASSQPIAAWSRSPGCRVNGSCCATRPC